MRGLGCLPPAHLKDECHMTAKFLYMLFTLSSSQQYIGHGWAALYLLSRDLNSRGDVLSCTRVKRRLLLHSMSQVIVWRVLLEYITEDSFQSFKNLRREVTPHTFGMQEYNAGTTYISYCHTCMVQRTVVLVLYGFYFEILEPEFKDRKT